MKVKIASFSNTFIEYLCSYIWFDEEKFMAMMKRYFIGATEQREPIFWHINTEHKITNGHIITLNADSGKVYDSSWYYHGDRPMCLFGEHLLQQYPPKTVALVKDEMTAAIMSCFPTPYLWLATGDSRILAKYLTALEGKLVIIFPNKGDFSKWQHMVEVISDKSIQVSNVMERTKGNFKTVAEVMLSQQPSRPTEEEIALENAEDFNPTIIKLVDSLGLEVVSLEHIDGTLASSKQNKKFIDKESDSIKKSDESLAKIKADNEAKWHGKNQKCHQCELSHEGIGGTYCEKFKRYVEYGSVECK